MKQEKDILKDCPELKQMPFSVPDGYFESFKAETSRTRVHKVSFWNKVAPYAAVAAVFACLVTAGTFLLESTVPQYQITEEDYVMFSDNIMTTIAYEMEYGSQIAEAELELSDEDIINYLIYTGVSAEFIEMSK